MNIDIVNLIESNPITKFNSNYQSKIIEKIKNNFTSYEQQLFLSSFYCYVKYDYQNDFVVDLDNVWQWLGFGQKVNAKRVLEKHFTLDKDYKVLLCQLAKQTRGGHNTQTFMLNIETFKKFCLKSDTKKADEIHDYFIKLERVFQDILLEESDELRIQLEQKDNDIKNIENDITQKVEQSKKKEYEEKLQKEKALEKEKMLLKEYATNISIVYVIKVKTFENNHYIIKIGESRRGVQGRYNEHKSKYEECLLLDCFSVPKSKDFEQFLHNHEQIRGNRVNDLKGHETELELFLIGKNLSYQMLSNIIHNNLKYFNQYDTNKLELEIEQLRLLLEMKQDNNENGLIQELTQSIKELTQTVNKLSSKIDVLERNNTEILNHFNATTKIKTTTGFNEPLTTLGPRLQKINPETLALVKIYESVSEAMKENPHLKRPSIQKAVIENTVYHGFRWLLVDRDINPNQIISIAPTKQTKIQNNGYIAKLNREKTHILNVYLDRKTAAKLNGFESSAALDIPVKKYTMVKNHYYKLYYECDNELIEQFETTHGKPCLYKNGVGQYNQENQLTQEFCCKYDCIKLLAISDKTLTKALEKEIQYNGNYYKLLPPKVSSI